MELPDILNNSIDILIHHFIFIPQKRDAVLTQKGSSDVVVHFSIETIVNLSVQFDAESQFGTIKVYDIRSDAELPSELQPVYLFAFQFHPE